MADELTVNPYYQYIDGDSIIIPDTSRILEDVQAEWVTVFGSALSLDPSTPQGRIMELSVSARKGTLELCALIANQINPYYATGQFLDGQGALFGLNRIKSTQTVTLANVGGVPGTLIPAGSQAKTEAGDVFYTPNDVTIAESGSQSAYFYSVESGAIPAAVDTLTKIVTPVIGWETINNQTAPILGIPQESDIAFRNRIMASRYSGIALFDAIQSKLNTLDDVIGYAIYNNPTGSSVVWDSKVTVPAHSICLFIQGGDDNEIANVLFETVTAGCGYTAYSDQSTTVSISYQAGVATIPAVVTFNRPAETNIKCQVTVKRNKYTGSDLEADVKNAVIAWANNQVEGVDGLKIGTPVYSYEIGAAVSQRIPEIIVQDVKIALESGTLSNAAIPIDVTQAAVLPNENITIVIAEG